MENITIRKVEQNEIAVVRELFEKVFKETFSSQVPAFEETTRGEQIYVAVMDHKIAGMAFDYVTGWKEIEKGMCEDGEYSLLSYLV